MAHRFVAGFYAMAEPFIRMDSESKNLLAVLFAEIFFGVIAIHIHMNQTIATGTVIGSLIAASRFFVKPRV